MGVVFILLTGISSAKEKPNILVLFIDDMGYADPSCYGNPVVETPHNDELADQGFDLMGCIDYADTWFRKTPAVITVQVLCWFFRAQLYFYYPGLPETITSLKTIIKTC